MAGKQAIKIKSSIKTGLIKESLKRRGPFAALGALLIITAGASMGVDLLKIWGLPIFIFGICLIGYGLFPYKKLTQLQYRPHEIWYDGHYYWFLKQGKPLLKIPKDAIAKSCFMEKNKLYGWAIWLEPLPDEKVVVFQKKFNFSEFREDSQAKFECDIFLPFFTENSIKDLLESDHAS